MARRPHLLLRRLEGELDRRKRPGFGSAPERNNKTHGAFLAAEAVSIVRANAQREDIAADPSVVLKVATRGYLDETQLAAMNLRVLSQTSDEAFVVHSPDPELAQFRERLSAYSGPRPQGQRGAVYGGTFDPIESIAPMRPEDRIGPTLKQQGVSEPDDLMLRDVGLYDIELWEADDGLHDLHVERVRGTVRDNNGELLSQYRGAGLFVVRVRCDGQCLRALASSREVALIDLPPTLDFDVSPLTDLTLEDLPQIEAPEVGVPCIGVIDSGVTSAHPMLELALAGAFGIPAALGDDDEKRHGTAVAGLAAYGDIAAQIEGGTLRARFEVASAKVVDGRGEFDDELTAPAVIEDAVRRLHAEFGARVINLSLADKSRIVGGRPSLWAVALDALARELDIVIVVAAGNIDDLSSRLADGGLGIYPSYLLASESRLYEPGSSLNSVVVGSIAHSNGLMPTDDGTVDIVPITEEGDLSPFTRTGPGYGGAIKPDFVDFGGTAVWQGYNATLNADRPNCGVLTLDANYTSHLLGYRYGTSFAAPLVAHKAAIILEVMPDASANLVRALLGVAADCPPRILAKCVDRQQVQLAGYGFVNVDNATESDDHRPILFVEDSLAPDTFAVYEVPIPTEFQTVRGSRHIRVSLAFDPPVRRTRKAYIGLGMGFHLVRGESEQDVFDKFRRWEKQDRKDRGAPFAFERTSWQCNMEPIATLREGGTLQVGTFVAERGLQRYGDQYYLVVRCESGWSQDVERQTFAVAVELWHEAQLELYQAVSVRLTV